MKWANKTMYFFMFLLLASIKISAQADTLEINTKYAVGDGMGNLFVITENNTLLKLDSNLTILISQSLISYGIASSIECNGATEVVVYCFNSGQLVVFDNFLKEKNRYDLSQFIKPNPTLVCLSKTGWWCYDEASSTISNYRSNFQKAWTLPKAPGLHLHKEILKIAEIGYALPVILFADTSVMVSKKEFQQEDIAKNEEFRFHSIPSLNFNTEVLLGYVQDSISRLTLHRQATPDYRMIKTELQLQNVIMVVRSFNTYFFIQPNAILAIRNLHE